MESIAQAIEDIRESEDIEKINNNNDEDFSQQINDLLNTHSSSISLNDFNLSHLPQKINENNNLKHLSACNNRISSIDPETWQNLSTRLETLSLGTNSLTELPTFPTPTKDGHQITLTILHLFDNNLVELPKSISACQHLIELNAAVNRIQHFPSEICRLGNLTKLLLHSNQIESMPDSIKYLQNLQVLSLSGNKLQRLPHSITYLAKLKELNVCMNELVVLPNDIGNLSALTELKLNDNLLTLLPTSIVKLKNLHHLTLNNNRFLAPGGLDNLDSSDAFKVIHRANLLKDTPVSTLGQEVFACCNSRIFSDVEFHVGDKIVPAHKVICARCDNFKALLTEKDIINITGIEAPIFLSVLQFLYSGNRKFLQNQQVAQFVQKLTMNGHSISHSLSPRTNFAEALNNPQFSDVTFTFQKENETEAKEVKAHRALLACRSKYFQQLFKTGVQEKQQTIPISDMSFELFTAIIKYIYTDSISGVGSASMVLDLLRFAESSHMWHLKFECEMFLCHSLTVPNALHMFQIAEEFQAPLLGGAVLFMITTNADDIEKTEHWNRLNPPQQEAIRNLVQNWETVLYSEIC